VFTRSNGKPVRDFRLTWGKAWAHAGAPDLLFHDLRRTGARNLRRAGVAEGIIMKIGGWRTRSAFERYAIVSRSDMNDAILKLQKSENRVEQERLRADEEQEQIRHKLGTMKQFRPSRPHPVRSTRAS
jgi:integrase